MRRDIETRIPDADPLIRDGHSRRSTHVHLPIFIDDRACDLCEFRAGPVLDLDACPGLGLEIDACRWCCHDEFDTVVLGQHGETVRADLVGGITVADQITKLV